MKRLNTVPPTILGVLLLVCLIGVYMTRNSGDPHVSSPPNGAQSGQIAVVDSSLLLTARQMASLAETADEQDQAREAEHLADHELDQAFTTALREAVSYRVPATGPLHDLSARIDRLRTQTTADQTAVDQLTKQTSSSAAADQLELAKAQLALDQDELDDAQQDLARQGGDPHTALERALQEHETTQHQAEQGLKSTSASPAATLVQQIGAWLSLGSRDRQILTAAGQADTQAAALASRHNELEKQTNPRPSPAATPASVDTATRIADLHFRSERRKSLAELDQRIQDCQQLAGVYKTWSGLMEARRGAVMHALLGSLAKILAILLAALLAILAIRHASQRRERKRSNQAPVMAAVAVEVVAAVLILLVIFGAPNQLSTIIGLATAGLTVALRDFIIALFGWFVLMGKHGIRVGDWVEINGVGGEVIQIGLLKTVLLELGNTASGHPTGRQVTFSNSFAMEGHYFNFSTSGQWLWDELVVSLPAAGDPYSNAQEIRTLVERETEADAAQATQDWERVTSQYGARNFSAKPAVDLRPSVTGLEVVVRYITRAPERYVMKSKLFQLIVGLLYKPAPAMEQAAP